MALLGDKFPEGKRRQFIDKRLISGQVVRTVVKFPDKNKPKLLLIVADDDNDYWTFIVNSEISPFVKRNPQLLKCQVTMDTAGHNFLKRESHITCDKVLRVHRHDLIREAMHDLDCIKGTISDPVKQQVIAAV